MTNIVRVFGILIAAIGVALVIVGLVGSGSIADSLSTAVFGRLTRQTMWYLVGGGLSVVVGVIMATNAFGLPRS